MANSPNTPPSPNTDAPPAKRKSSRFKLFSAACYCGLGPDCAMFRIMTPEQRAMCSLDMRRTMQLYYKNGLNW